MGNIEKSDKSKFLNNFESLRPDLFFPETWTDEQREKAVDLVRPQKTRTSMFSSIPMNCEASKCTFADTCPLLKENLAPRGKPCPIEMSIVSQFTAEYMEQLEEHFIQENIIGVDNDGMPILKKELHLAVELEDRLHRRRKDLRNQLLATREAKAKVGQTQLDSAQAISDILFKVQSLENQREKLLKQKLGIYDKDDYIEIPSSEVKE